MQYLLWVVLTSFLRRTPPAVAYAFASFCGRLAFACMPRLRQTTLGNYRRVLPGASPGLRRTVARQSVENYCQYLVDFARMTGRAEQLEYRAGDAFERLRCITRQRGAVIVPMHFGNWDAGAAAAIREGFPLTVVGDLFGDPRLDRAVFGARERLGLRVLPSNQLGPSLLRPLRERGLVALLLDKPSPGTGVRVPFFGECVEVPGGPARIALATGAAIVPVAFPRVARGHRAIRVLADFSIETTPTGDREADIRRITAAVMAAHERFIRAYPEQWYMFREMWPVGAHEGSR